jgi:aspartate racemase
MSWESSIEYYRIINQAIRAELGGVHSGKIVMVSLDFADIEGLQNQGKWDEATQILVNAGKIIEKAGADFLLICTNTMHLMADEVQAEIGIPLLHIADATARNIKERKLIDVGLLGTRFTMEKDFYKVRLEEKHHLKVLIPDQDGRDTIHQVIYEELVKGVINPASKKNYQDIISDLIDMGAQGIILACTEIGLLIKQDDVPVPIFDTMEIHALAAVKAALGTYPLSI